MRVIIAGSRGFNDYPFLLKKLDELLPSDTIIVSGGARGADMLGERYAVEHGMGIERMPAEWRKNLLPGMTYNRSAGIERNRRMAQHADWLVAFNAGTPGTTNMIKEMRKLGKRVVEIKVMV